ncbi:MAG TPA: protein kinase, partial [Chloroflexia bacterium]|nr:protein kinase [Chloroflexia bacterium]
MHSDPEATKLIPGSDEPLAGRYRLIEKIGEGGAAEVYRARDERLGRMVAIKRLRPQFTGDDASRSRFTIEARTAAGLSHPNIVDVYDFGESPDGSMWIAMQYVEGQNLKDVLHRRGRMTAAEVVQVVQQVCAALSVAHAKGLIHRDVKPQNIMIDRAGDVRLTDFGIVKALSGPELTMTGMTFGTAAYLSPEQATGEPLSPASDIYALGCVMYEMLAGTPPFTGDNPAVVAYKQVWEQPRPLHDLVPEVPPSLESIVMRCLNKEPARRYPSTDMLAADLATMSSAFNQPTQMVPLGAAAGGAVAAGAVAGGIAAADTPVGLEATPRAEMSQPIPMPGGPQHVPPVVAQTTAPAASMPGGIGQGTRPVSAPYNPAPAASTVQRAVPYDTRASRVTVVDTNRRGGAGVLLPLALLLLVVLGGIIIFLASQGVFGGTPGVTPPATATVEEPTATVAAIVPVTPTTATLPTPTMLQPLPTETPTSTPTDTPEPLPTETPESVPTNTPEPLPTDTPEPLPTETPAPADPTATVPVVEPPPATNSITLEDNAFVGGFTNPDGLYHNRTAQWVYGQGTEYSSMTAGFNIREAPRGPG